MISASQFQQNYDEFGNTEVYSPSVVQNVLTLAYLMLNSERWGAILDYGAQLFTAHYLALARRSANENASDNSANNPTGTMIGPISARSVDKASVNYDTANAIIEGGNHWNLTIYGVQFLDMSRMVGAGPMQVGAGAGGMFTGSAFPQSELAWPGPDCSPGWFGS